MLTTRCARVDSYRAARGALAPLFRPGPRPPEHTHHEVRRYVLTRSRHLDRLSRSQQRSWVRANLSLVLHEARRRRHFTVAEAALLVALTSPEWVEVVDPAWLKDAAAACGSAEELQRLQMLLAAHPARVAPLHGGSGGGQLLAVLLGGSTDALAGAGVKSAVVGSTAVQLDDGGDGDGEPAALSAMERADVSGGGSDARQSLLQELSSQTHALAALTTTTRGDSLAAARLGPSGLALAAVRRLGAERDAAVVAPNPSLARYFLRQGIVRGETELTAMVAAMRARPEEMGFRVHLSHPYGRAACELLDERAGIARVEWLPAAAGAYVLQCGHAAALPANRALLRALAKERIVSYQSTSSMLPVLMLDPQPGERVLDLCASPGSKSTLLLDLMTTSAPESRADSELAASPLRSRDGCVCANEADAGRAADLAARLQNYAAQAVVTHGRGEHYGRVSTPTGAGALSAAPAVAADNWFDRVLVDAPCSGEGRMGREVMAWRLWHPRQGLSFFPRQLALLRRAVELCRPGGTIVYATCTLNPIENEAVVAATLEALAGHVELIEPPPLSAHTRRGGASAAAEDALRTTSGASARLLTLDSGLSHWLVPSPSGGFYASPREATAQEGADDALPVGVFFAPGAADGGEALAAQLRRCCRRVLPHHNGPGSEGFFVAVLRKTRPTRPPVAPVADRARTAPDAAAVFSSPPSLLQARGLSRLPVTSSRVQRLLGPFFAAPSDAAGAVALMTGRHTRGVDAFLTTCALVPLWSTGEGLRLVSAAAAELTRARPSSIGGPMALIELGVLVFNAAGELTERGAVLLSGHATARLLRLPALHVHLLLTNRHLDVDGSAAVADPVGAALREASNGLVPASLLESRAVQGGAWVRQVLAQLRMDGSGSAIVTVASAGSAASAQAWAPLASDWALPVRVEVRAPLTADGSAGAVRLHLLLSREARQRCVAMIGRLQGLGGASANREPRAQAQLDASADLRASLVMSGADLFGKPLDAAAQSRALYGAATSPVAGAPPEVRHSTDAEDVFEF